MDKLKEIFPDVFTEAKIDCGTAHFKALDSDVKFIKATRMNDVKAYI